jgi:hypothetical protein
MARTVHGRDFQAKLSILFDEMDSFTSDADRRGQMSPREHAANPDSEATPAKPVKEDAEPGCLPFAVRRMRAESNPFLMDFFRLFQDKGKLSSPRKSGTK